MDSDELLYVLSVKKQSAWEEFKKFFKCLYEGDCDKQVVTALESLGHCEFDFIKKRVYVAPPVLVRLPYLDPPQAILSGARTPQTFQKLEETCRDVSSHITCKKTEQGGPIGTPDRICIHTETVGELQQIANLLGIHFSETPSAQLLLNFSGSLEEYLATIQWSEELELNWESRTFDPADCKFYSSVNPNSKMRLREYKHPNSEQRIYYLWETGKSAKVERNWGRYAILKTENINVMRYNEKQHKIEIPLGAKLPRLLERALTLCSGYIAENIEGFNVFRDIPPKIAKTTADKLGQTLILSPLED
ncbi:hypothetical protein NG798_22290 [Ancylothrix sp. C2]|uniref:hypothetical protein n=1 Tax=Ancylothrix sp. D3o TaxID=2953691 RepID=UPI0021BAC908|nr:hypothetical protein [Ancylothrix sp. D3o]MCT7952529.1 hypothetical protein [Ancylothrix sp. D3o]